MHRKKILDGSRHFKTKADHDMPTRQRPLPRTDYRRRRQQVTLEHSQRANHHNFAALVANHLSRREHLFHELNVHVDGEAVRRERADVAMGREKRESNHVSCGILAPSSLEVAWRMDTQGFGWETVVLLRKPPKGSGSLYAARPKCDRSRSREPSLCSSAL